MDGLGDKIYALRKTKNLSQEEFGEELGVSRQAVSQWETEAITPRADKINLMCRKFGVNWEYFFPQGDKKDGVANSDEPLSTENKTAEEKKTDKTAKVLIIIFAAAAALFCILAVILAAVIPDGSDEISSTVVLNFSSPAVVVMFICCLLFLLILTAAIIIKHIKK